MHRNTGAGVCCPNERLGYCWSLGNFSTVFLVEVFAILLYCRICIGKRYKNICIHICLDSQGALLALYRYNFTSCIVWEFYSLLCQLPGGNYVTLYQVLGHSGIQGNEVADDLARNGSTIPFAGPEPATGILSNLIRNIVFDIFRKKQYLNWLSCKGQWQAKELNEGYSRTRQKELFKRNRNGLRKVIGLLTELCLLKRHLTIMSVKNPTCKGYYDNKKMAVHILCECEVYSAYRFEHLDRHLLESWELHDNPVRCLLNFASATYLFQVLGLGIVQQTSGSGAGFFLSHPDTIHSFKTPECVHLRFEFLYKLIFYSTITFKECSVFYIFFFVEKVSFSIRYRC